MIAKIARIEEALSINWRGTDRPTILPGPKAFLIFQFWQFRRFWQFWQFL